MGHFAVKRKLQFLPVLQKKWVWGCLAFAFVTLLLSLLPVLPAAWVEAGFSRKIFPVISTFFGFLADALPVAWLDIALPAGILYIVVCAIRRRWIPIAIVISIGYLIFFWSWGINYHRLPLITKLYIDPNVGSPASMEEFARRAATELNRLYDT